MPTAKHRLRVKPLRRARLPIRFQSFNRWRLFSKIWSIMTSRSVLQRPNVTFRCCLQGVGDSGGRTETRIAVVVVSSTCRPQLGGSQITDVQTKRSDYE